MQYALALPTLVTVVTLAFMGFVVTRNGQERTNKLFLAFIMVDVVWILSVFLIIHTPLGKSELLSRLAYAAALALAIVVQIFTDSLFSVNHGKSYRITLYGCGVVVLLATLVTSWVISGIHTVQGLPYPEYGFLYPLFVVYLLAAILVFLAFLIKRWQAMRRSSETVMRRRLNSVIMGLVVFALISIITNLILPALFSSSWPSQFTPLGSLVLAASFFYAMGRYRLFNIRRSVVRGAAYAVLIGVLALVFVSVVNVTSSRVTVFQDHPNLQSIFSTLIALIIAVSFQPLRRLFDKITNRIFFRDIYDTQQVVDKLNRILISNVDIADMLGRCEELLADMLKLEFCFFGVLANKETSRIFGAGRQFTNDEYAILRKGVFSINQKVFGASTVPVNMKGLHDLMWHKQIGAVGKMIVHDDVIGFVVFGDKKNGSSLSSQDFGVLAIVADQVAIATQNVLRFEEIQKFNVTLQKKVSGATAELRRTNSRLRMLDQTKDEFISMASHQLRTPLTSVKGYLSMVLEGDAGKLNANQRKLLEQSYASSQRMVYLISDLLNLSRLNTGKFVIEPSLVNLSDVVQDEVDQLAETAKSRELELVYNRPANFPQLMLDETKIHQVVMNLIDNAIYYTPAGGTVTVNLRETPTAVEYTVHDTGIGVPKAVQHKLFTKFYRAANAQQARPDGTGLGLFMAKKVVVAQGGSIIFESEQGKGSTFGFRFSKAGHAVPHAPQLGSQPAAKQLVQH